MIYIILPKPRCEWSREMIITSNLFLVSYRSVLQSMQCTKRRAIHECAYLCTIHHSDKISPTGTISKTKILRLGRWSIMFDVSVLEKNTTSSRYLVLYRQAR
jgi:hypothetical protein